MAGGIGSRFWPLSTQDRPKQFIDILGVGKSLLQLTFDRFNKIFPAENILVVTSERYREMVLEQLPRLTFRPGVVRTAEKKYGTVCGLRYA